jgi:hypothetical protein
MRRSVKVGPSPACLVRAILCNSMIMNMLLEIVAPNEWKAPSKNRQVC